MTSLLFLCGILPLALLLDAAGKTIPAKNRILLAVSLLFYAWMSWQACLVLIMVLFWTWAAGQGEQGEANLILNVGFLALLLVYFRLLLPWLSIKGLAVPIGISFYIFSAIAYLADVYTGKSVPETSLVKLGLYLAFFGRIWQGPIGQWTQLAPQLEERKAERAQGTLQLIRGLAKKVLLADALCVFCAGLAAQTTWAGSWLLAIGWSFQLYFDFSGYSDMAIGISRMFGFRIPANFAHPYRAGSIKAFWNKWNISLAVWFREYIYLPLGGKNHPVRNAMAVWLVTILWHGGTLPCIFWGLWACGWQLALRRHPVRLGLRLRQLLVFLYALVGWVFFCSPTAGAGLTHLGRLLGLGCSGWIDGTAWLLGRDYLAVLLVCVLFSGSLRSRLEDRLARLKLGMPALALVYGLLALMSLAVLVSGGAQPFIYSHF